MLRRLTLMSATLAALVAVTPASAQQNPLAAPDTTFNGTWKLDPARSDSLPPAMRPEQPAPRGRAGGGGNAAGSGDRGRAQAGGRGSGMGGSGGRAGGRAGGGRGGGAVDATVLSARLAEVAPATLTFKVSSDLTVITPGLSDAFTWETDKKKHLVAFPKGGTFQVEASWWQKVLQTIETLDKNTELKRDLKQVDGGKGLEVKVSGKISGKKVSFKLYYTRAD